MQSRQFVRRFIPFWISNKLAGFFFVARAPKPGRLRRNRKRSPWGALRSDIGSIGCNRSREFLLRCRRLVRPELHAAYYKGQIRLTAAEQNVFQQTAALPRLDQDAANCGLSNGPVEATSTARPKSCGTRGCSEQPNDPPGQVGGISFRSRERLRSAKQLPAVLC